MSCTGREGTTDEIRQKNFNRKEKKMGIVLFIVMGVAPVVLITFLAYDQLKIINGE